MPRLRFFVEPRGEPASAWAQDTCGAQVAAGLLAGLCVSLCPSPASVSAWAAAQHETETLRVAVYDVPPYGYVECDGSMSGVSVDLWRRVAEQMEWSFHLIPVSDMESILSGLEQGRFDVAIGAITITPERAARVDFSYPAHRSGVALALRKETGPMVALVSYWTAVSELSPLILVIVAMLIVIGLAMWVVEKRDRSAAQGSDSAVVSLRDGLYWAESKERCSTDMLIKSASYQ